MKTRIHMNPFRISSLISVTKEIMRKYLPVQLTEETIRKLRLKTNIVA